MIARTGIVIIIIVEADYLPIERVICLPGNGLVVKTICATMDGGTPETSMCVHRCRKQDTASKFS